MENTLLQPGAELYQGKFRIIKVIGQGGFGVTYLGVHTGLDKKVAIKEFFPKGLCGRNTQNNNITLGTSAGEERLEKLKAKFLKEARNIAKLDHPNIIAIQDVFQENDTAYYVMDFLEGESLQQILEQKGKLSEEDALRYIRPIADAVEYMHSKRMNHLDIKPSNVMVRNSDQRPILIDFGTAKQYDEKGYETSVFEPGFSHGFAPIEQYSTGGVSSFSPQTDIYALGATLFNLLTGERPPHFSDIQEFGLPELPEEVSSTVKNAVIRSMSTLKSDRQETVEMFIEELSGPKEKKEQSGGDAKADVKVEDDSTTILQDPQTETEETEMPGKYIQTEKTDEEEATELKIPAGEKVVEKEVKKEEKIPENKKSDKKSIPYLWVTIVGLVVVALIVGIVLLTGEGGKDNEDSEPERTERHSNRQSSETPLSNREFTSMSNPPRKGNYMQDWLGYAASCPFIFPDLGENYIVSLISVQRDEITLTIKLADYNTEVSGPMNSTALEDTKEYLDHYFIKYIPDDVKINYKILDAFGKPVTK